MSTRSLTVTLIFSALMLVGVLTYLFVLREPPETTTTPPPPPTGDQSQEENDDAAEADADTDDDTSNGPSTTPNGLTDADPPPMRGEPLANPIEDLAPEVVRQIREMARMLGDTDPVQTEVRERVPADIAEAELLMQDWRAVPILESFLDTVEDEDHLERLEFIIEDLRNEPYGVAGGAVFPHAWLDGNTNQVYVEAVARRTGRGPLEHVLTGPLGRSHHSLFEMRGTGWHLADLLAKLPLAETSPAARPQFDGDWVLYDGASVSIQVRYRDQDGNLALKPIEELIELEGHQMPPTGWIHLGAPVGEQHGITQADEAGVIISLFTHPRAILTSPWPSSREPDAATVRRAHALPEGEPVQLVFVPTSLAERQNQREALEPAWHEWLEERREILADRGLEDRSDEVPDELPQDAGFDPSIYEFAPMVPELSEEEIAQFERLVNVLARDDTPEETWQETLDKVAQHDSRYVPLLEAAYRERREDRRLRDAITPDLLEQMSHRGIVEDGIHYWMGFAYDPARNLLIADASIAPADGRMPLEFIACSLRGKHHESLFVLHGHPYNMEQVFDMMGLARSSMQPLGEQDWILYDGDFLVVEAAWREDEEAGVPPALGSPEEVRDTEGIRFTRVEDLVRNGSQEAQETMPRTGFAYAGSAITPAGVHLAEANGGVVAVYQRGEYAVLENPWYEGAVPHHYYAWRDRLPAVNWPVRLFFTVEPPEPREQRMEELAERWRDVKYRRPRIEVDEIPEDWRAHWRRGHWRWMGPNHSFLQVRPEFNRFNEREITEDYRDWLKERIAFENENQEVYLFEEELEYQGMPAWRFAYRDKDSLITQRLVAINRRFIYDAIFFVPDREAELETLAEAFDDWLERFTWCRDENRIDYVSEHEVVEVEYDERDRLLYHIATPGEPLPDVLARDIVLDLIEPLVKWESAQAITGEAFEDESAHAAWLAAGGRMVVSFHTEGEPADEPYFVQGLELVENE